jgi:hypothetical protein
MLEDARRRASAVPTKSCATRRANHATGGSSLRSKNIPLFSHANQFIPAAVPPGKRGVAHVTAVIAGLIVVLSAGQAPASLSRLQEKLSIGASALSQFCGTVINLLPKTAGQTEKGVGIDILKAIPLEQLLKMLSDGVSALYTNHRSDDALTRRTIQTQLESARWPAFSEVKSAQ